MNDPFSQMILQPFPMTFAGFVRLEQFRESLSSQISQHTICSLWNMLEKTSGTSLSLYSGRKQ